MQRLVPSLRLTAGSTPIRRFGVTIRVPATSANMGPGFDCCGVAVQLFNEVKVQTHTGASSGFKLTNHGEGAKSLPTTPDHLVVKAAQTAFEAEGKKFNADHYHFTCTNRIPCVRGLGSSSAAIVGGLAAGYGLMGADCTDHLVRHKILQLAANFEGHPDNVAPAIYGGFQLALKDDTRWLSQSVSLPANLQWVMYIPDREMATAEARMHLKPEVPVSDAVHNISRVGLMVHAFSSGQLHLLKVATQDKLHQPHRGKVFPLSPMIDAAIKAGAHGAWLSGSGSTIMAVVSGAPAGSGNFHSQQAVAVEQALIHAAAALHLPGRSTILPTCFDGVTQTKE